MLICGSRSWQHQRNRVSPKTLAIPPSISPAFPARLPGLERGEEEKEKEEKGEKEWLFASGATDLLSVI